MQNTTNNNIIWLDTIDSTNDEAKRRIHLLNHLSVIAAYQQTSGRGQRGNTWSSEPGKNLTFSIIIKYGKEGYHSIIPSNQFIINMIASIAVLDFLYKYNIQAAIKWPNDIYVNEKKIAGILIEHTLQDNSLGYSIIGIGINVNQRYFDSSLYNPTSIVIESPEIEIPNLQTILEEFMDGFKNVLEHKSINELDASYLSKLWRLNVKSKFVDFTSLPKGFLETPIGPTIVDIPHSTQFTGTIIGISKIGELLIEDENSSKIKKFGFKEIGYII